MIERATHLGKAIGSSLAVRGVAVGLLCAIPVAYAHDRLQANTRVQIQSAQISAKEAVNKCSQVILYGWSHSAD